MFLERPRSLWSVGTSVGNYPNLYQKKGLAGDKPPPTFLEGKFLIHSVSKNYYLYVWKRANGTGNFIGSKVDLCLSRRVVPTSQCL